MDFVVFWGSGQTVGWPDYPISSYIILHYPILSCGILAVSGKVCSPKEDRKKLEKSEKLENIPEVHGEVQKALNRPRSLQTDPNT